MTEQTLKLRKKRDFGEVFSDTVTFIKEHFKPLSMAVLLIAGPFVILHAIYAGITQINLMDFREMDFRLDMLMLNFGLVALLGIVSTIIVSTVGYVYVKLALQYKKEEITSELVWKQVKMDIGRSIKITIAFTIIGAMVVALFAALFFISPILVLLMFFAGLFLIYAFVKLAFTYNAAILDEQTTIDSMSYSWGLSTGYFWPTIGLILITSIIVSVIGGILYFPAIILQVLSQLLWTDGMPLVWKSVMIISNILGQIVSSFAYIIYVIVLCLQYFSIQEEKEGRGLLERIDEMGSSPQDGNFSSEKYY